MSELCREYQTPATLLNEAAQYNETLVGGDRKHWQVRGLAPSKKITPDQVFDGTEFDIEI